MLNLLRALLVLAAIVLSSMPSAADEQQAALAPLPAATTAPYDPHPAIRQSNYFAGTALYDCASTMVNTSMGAYELHWAPKFFHVDTSFLNCLGYMGVQWAAIRFDRNKSLRNATFVFSTGNELDSDVNNTAAFWKLHKAGNKIWQKPFYSYLRFQWVKLF